MKKIACFFQLFLLPIGAIFSQVVINEVHVKPTGGDTDQAFQSLFNSTPTFGSEFIEIYNSSSCTSVDISCWTIGGMDGGTNGGAFSFPAGTVIAPLSFITVGGPNTPGVTFNLNLAANSARLWRSNAARWHLPNGDGWLALYDATGTAVDAVYWTFASNDPTKLNSDATYTTGALQRIAVCGGGGLATASSIPGIEYIPQASVTGQSYERSTDGGSTWVLGTATPNNCNGICATSSVFQLNATVVQPTCGNSNGSISFAPSPSGTYFFTWPFPSTGNMSSATGLAPGTYNIIITNLAGCSIDTLITLTDIPCGNVCDPNGNLVIYSNYDGGILTINVDQNIPNLKVGICTYEPIQVAFTGPFVGNITQVIYAGMNSNQNNNNCGLGNFTTSISGVPAGLVTISPPMNPPLVGYTPAHGNGSGPWGGGMLGVAGFCDTTVNAAGGNTPDEVVYYFLNATSGTLLFHQTQYACWVNETINITAGGNCCILPPISNPCPTLTVATSSQTNVACFGQSTGTATVSASGGNGPYTYTWTPGNLNGASQSALAAGTYTINVTDNNNCPGSGTLTINQPTSGLTVSASATSTNCGQSTGSATSTPSGGTGTYSYVWSPSGGTGASASNLVAGTYTVTVTDQNGCQSSTNATVSSIGGPTVTLVSSAPVTCFGDNDGTATVSASGGSGALTYTWSPSGGNSATANGLSAGTYTVTVTDASSCTGSLTVTIGGPTQIAVVEMITNASCGSNNGSISTNVSGGAGTYTYSWTPNGETTPSITGLSQGAYSVTVSDANGCSITENYNVVIIGTLPVIATPVSSTINEGDSVQLNVTGATIYSWTPTSGLSCTNCPNPIAFPSSTTTYIVTGTDATGCAGSDTVIVFVVPIIEPCGELFVPTVLAPDGTGPTENKKVCIYGGCVSELTFAIFNRWGEKVFESTNTNLSECWDGTYKGQPMNAAVFTYKLIVTLNNGEQIKESGNITLIR
jgi:gliding motility-associated-like protein